MKINHKIILSLIVASVGSAASVLAADFTTMTSWINKIIGWMHFLLVIATVYFGWLLVKGGQGEEGAKKARGMDEGGFAKIKGWHSNRQNNKKLERIEKATKTAELRDLVREKQAVNGIKKVVSLVGIIEKEIVAIPIDSTSGSTNNVSTSGKTTVKVIKNIKKGIEEANTKIDDALKEVKKEYRSTKREERKAGKLIKLLIDEGYDKSKIQKLKIFEDNILLEHDKVKRYLEEVKAELNQYITQKLPAVNRKTKDPVIVDNLGALKDNITSISLKVKAASEFQDKAYEISVDLANAFEKIYKGEKPTTI